MAKYTQVKLEREHVYDVRWIPSTFAKVGKGVSFDEDGERVWVVTEVYGTREWYDFDFQNAHRDRQRVTA